MIIDIRKKKKISQQHLFFFLLFLVIITEVGSLDIFIASLTHAYIRPSIPVLFLAETGKK